MDLPAGGDTRLPCPDGHRGPCPVRRCPARAEARAGAGSQSGRLESHRAPRSPGRRPPEGNSPKTIHSQIVVDALTGRLVKWEQSGYTITTIAYDQPLPDRLFTWKPPAGIQVTEIGDWWGERLGRTLATAQSRSWDLTIH